MLGEAQWQWLEQTLRQPAQLRIVVSSIQLVASGHGWERWGLLPTEAQRFYSLVETTRAEGVVVVSGDRHIGGVYKMENQHTSTTNGVVDGPYRVPYTIWDITSSALTHTYAGHEDATCVMAANGTFGEASCDEAGPNRIGPLVHLNNLGLIDLDWDAPNGGTVVISLVKAERTPKQGFNNDAVCEQHTPVHPLPTIVQPIVLQFALKKERTFLLLLNTTNSESATVACLHSV